MIKEKDSISLYIHIPFCKKRCAYCDFFSTVLPCSEHFVPNEYISALVKEAEYRVSFTKAQSWKTIYLGGGTPSLLSCNQLKSLLFSLQNILPLSKNAEITMELNPDDVTEELLLAARESNVNRLSLGVQSLNDEILLEEGRRCTVNTTQKALNLIKNNWRARFSLDLIAGFPNQTKAMLIQSLESALSYNPDHVSLYALCVEEKTQLFKMIDSGFLKYDADIADELWLLGRDYLCRNGFNQYEVSNFSLPGFESIHNQTYWNLDDYIGIGSGATGTFYSNFESEKKSGIRITNTKDIQSYIQFWNNPNSSFEQIPESKEILDSDTEMFEFLMMNFRTLKGASSEEYYSRFRKNLENRLGVKSGIFYEWEKKGLAHHYKKNNQNYFALTKEGLLFLNSFLEQI